VSNEQTGAPIAQEAENPQVKTILNNQEAPLDLEEIQEIPTEVLEKAANSKKFWKRHKKEKVKKTLKQEIFSWIWTLLAALLIASLVRMYIAEPIKVDGRSMHNTLKDGEIVLASKLDYLFGDVQRGDIVICRYPGRMEGSIHLGASLSLNSYTLFVKRVVALPGDVLSIHDGVLYVNGFAVPNPEHMGSLPADYPLTRLGEDEYFVIGDNRGNSRDSRSAEVGPIARDAIMGKVKCVVWPLSNIRGVE